MPGVLAQGRLRLAGGPRTPLLWTPPVGPGAAYWNLVMSRPTLMGYWPMNETVGTIAWDYAGPGNNGTYINSPILGSPGPLAVEPSVAAVFTQTQHEYVTIPHAASLNIFAGADWTWIGWFTDPVTPAVASVLMHKGRTGLDGGPNVVLNSIVDGSLAATADGFGNGAHSSKLVNDAPQWHQAAVTFTTATSAWLLYVDGADVTVTDAASPTSNSSTPLEFGRRSDDVRFQDGGMAQFQIYSSKLTPMDIANDYVIGKAMFPWVGEGEPSDQIAS